MAHLEVRLLGRPSVLIDGVVAPPPRGAKTWGVLAYLLASGRSHPRVELAELLFSEANDPLGALRWTLAALRRLLDRPDALKGDDLRLDLTDVTVDTRLLDAGDPAVLHRPGSEADLLAGIDFPDSPLFELWLAGERRRLAARSTSLLRETTLTLLAQGDHAGATATAIRLVAIDQIDEGHQALLIRVHALSGDAPAARDQLARCRAVLRTELGIEPGAAVTAAAHLAASRSPAPGRPVDPEEIAARVAVAWQSFLGGAVDHGIDLGRGAVALADRDGDLLWRATARLFLGSTLAIAVRGWDECSVAVTEALQMAIDADLPFEEATARGILAGNELMRADYPAAVHHATLGAATCDEPLARASNLTFLSAAEADTGHGEAAIAHAVEAVAAATAADGDPIRIMYAACYTAHALLLGGDPAAARPHVERAIEAAAPMLVLQPWPLAMLAEIDVAAGHLDAAWAGAARAAALAATTDIAYQRGLAQRSMALVEAARGDDLAAVERLTDALGQARRTTGEGFTFHWPVAWILETLAVVTSRTDRDASRRWTETLLDEIAVSGMEAFRPRAEALLHPAPA